jgi:hypothetical protein
MAEQTTDVHGLDTEVPTDDLRAVLEQVDPTDMGIVSSGDLLAWGDGHFDGDGYLLNADAEEKTGRIDLEAIDPEPSFAEFVEDEFDVEVANTDSDVAYIREADVDVTTTQSRDTLGRSKGQALDNSDDVEMTYITFGENGGFFADSEDDRELLIGLKDTRDE